LAQVEFDMLRRSSKLQEIAASDLRPDHAAYLADEATLAREVVLEGVGLHSGEPITLKLSPAPKGSGIRFLRSDLSGAKPIPARYDHVIDTTLSTVIGHDDVNKVSTVEHLMSAVAALGLTNALVEVSGPEVPVMDGSAQVFAEAIEAAGLRPQPAVRQALLIREPVEIVDGIKRAAFLPQAAGENHNGLSLSFEIEFDNQVIGREQFSVDLTDPRFADEILHARTFGLLKDVQMMWDLGLAKGGSLDNCIIVGEDRVMNEDGLRYEDEFVRHKILDAVGDLSLAGAPIIGRYEAVRSGHALNNRLLKALFARPEAWELVELDGFFGEPEAPLMAVSAD